MRIHGVGFLLGLALSLAGCGAGLGEHCVVDQDCESGLRCSTGGDGRRGVCIYAAEPVSDRGAPDRPGPDAPRGDRAGEPSDLSAPQ
jgi:hypothetical protein